MARGGVGLGQVTVGALRIATLRRTGASRAEISAQLGIVWRDDGPPGGF